LFIRLIHGFSTGFTPTGQSAYLSDVIPAQRRGEAMGIMGTAGTLGMAIGPPIGGVIANQFSINALFYASSLFAILALFILRGIKETLPVRNKFSTNMLKISRYDLFDFKVWMPCLVMVLCSFSYGTILTLVPDLSEFAGIKNKGFLFIFFTIASLAVRLLGGKASDRYGRKNVLIVATAMIAGAMTWIGFSDSPHDLMIGMTLYGLGQGMAAPTLLAWATDLSDELHKGRGIASLYIAMELGIGSGAFASALIYGNNASHFIRTFLMCGLLSALAFIFLLSISFKRKTLPKSI
jgi:MFS family permease